MVSFDDLRLNFKKNVDRVETIEECDDFLSVCEAEKLTTSITPSTRTIITNIENALRARKRYLTTVEQPPVVEESSANTTCHEIMESPRVATNQSQQPDTLQLMAMLTRTMAAMERRIEQKFNQPHAEDDQATPNTKRVIRIKWTELVASFDKVYDTQLALGVLENIEDQLQRHWGMTPSEVKNFREGALVTLAAGGTNKLRLYVAQRMSIQGQLIPFDLIRDFPSSRPAYQQRRNNFRSEGATGKRDGGRFDKKNNNEKKAQDFRPASKDPDHP